MASTRKQADLPAIGAAAGPDSILGDFTGARPGPRAVPDPPAAPRAAPPAPSPLTTAREMVAAARTAAKEHPGSVTAFTVRLPAGLRDRVTDRVITDTVAMQGQGHLPAASHLVDAALRAIPEDLDEAARWVREWRDAEPGQALGMPVSVGAGVRADTRNAMVLLTKRLKRLDARIPAWHVHAAAVRRLLERLDAEDEHGAH